jgi:hypothetical protein
MEEFVHSDVDKFVLSIFVKIRIRNSNLNIERGRYIKLPVEKRIHLKYIFYIYQDHYYSI